MGAIDRYKFIIQELYFIFSKIGERSKISLDLLRKEEVKVMHYANRIADEIKGELIGGGVELEIRGRLKIAYWVLGRDPNVASYFPLFESPENNNVMFDAVVAIYGDEADEAKKVVQSISKWANFMVEEVSKMLEEVCKFVGYTPELHKQTQEATNTDSLAVEQPEPQQGEQEQQKNLHYYCHKAIEKGYFVKVDDGYRIKNREWTKAQLAYFLNHFLNADGTFPDKEYCVMFGESRLSKAANQLMNNKNGDGKPRGYKKVDELLQG